MPTESGRRRRSSTPAQLKNIQYFLASRHRSRSPRHRRERRRSSRSRSRRDKSPSSSPAKEDLGKPNMKLSGKLAAEANTVNGVVLKYAEPAEAKLPGTRWRIYVFKNGEALGDPIPLHRQTCFLLGRDRTVCDIPADHPSCSKQHCVIQFRCVESPEGGEIVKPYLMDLDSINGTFVNKERIDSRRYYEILEQDTVRIGMSSREYVFLHEGSQT